MIAVSSDHSIYAQEGSTVELPSPLADPLQVTYYPSGKMEGGVTINVYHPYYPLNVMVNYVTTNATTGETVQEKSFVSADIPTGVIRIPESLFEVEGNREITISIVNTQPDFDTTSSTYESIDAFNRLQVQITTGTYGRVEDMYPVYSTVGTAGMFNYYLYSKRKGDTAFVYLRVESGEADMYIRKSGDKNLDYPDLDTYDYSSAMVKNDQIVIPETDKDPKVADVVENFLIGVYSFTNCVYSLQVSTNPGFKFMKIFPGTVISEKIDPDRPLLVSMMNPVPRNFTLTASGVYSGVNVWGKLSDDTRIYDFIDMVPDFEHDKPLLETKQGHVIKKIQGPIPTSNKYNMWTFLIKPNFTDQVTFFVEMGKKPLKVPIGIGLFDVMTNDNCQSYSFQYDTQIFDETLKISIEQGRIEVIIADKDPAFFPGQLGESFSMNSDGIVVSDKFKLKNSIGGKDHDTLTPDVFDSFHVRVCSRSKLALFELKTYKPSSRYYELKAGERLTIDTNENNKMYYYYVDEKTTSLKVKISLRVNERRDEFITQEFDATQALQFFYTSNEAFGQASNKKLNSNDPDNLVRAEVKSSTQRGGGVEAMIFSLNVQKGYFIIKPRKLQSSAHLVRMQLIVNDYRRLPMSGNTFESIQPGKVHTFMISKPTLAFTRVRLSACKGEVEVRTFEGDQRIQKGVFVIGNLPSTQNPNIFDVEKPGLIDFTSDESVMFIEVSTTTDNGEDALVVFNVMTYTEKESLGIEDYFMLYSLKTLPFFNQEVYKIIKHRDSYDMVIGKIEPAEGFSKAYKQFNRVEIYYRLHTATNGFPLETRMALKNKCGIDFTDKRYKNDGLIIAEQMKTIYAKNGVFDWSQTPITLNSNGYPEGPEPYSCILQLKLVFLGEDDDSEDDDSTIIFKHPFEISNFKPVETINPIKALIFVISITLVLGLIICAVVFWVNRNKGSNQAPGKGFRPVNRENEMHKLQLDSTNSRIENADEHVKADMDETV